MAASSAAARVRLVAVKEWLAWDGPVWGEVEAAEGCDADGAADL